jgi:CheY-like chemotaxis protein
VELHGGTVTAYSEGHGKGSEFVIELPLIEQQRQPSVHGEAPGQAPLGGLRILVVDDNKVAAHALSTFLNLQGHEVRIAHNGLQAVDEAGSFRPQVVLCDIGLPGLNGYEVAEKLKSDPALEETYVIATSGYGEEANRARASKAGFDRYLVKPLNLPQLHDMLADQFRGAGKHRHDESNRAIKFRNHPLMRYRTVPNWPPVWSTTAATTKPVPQGEIGTVEEVAMNDLYDNRIFIRISCEGERYLGTLLFDDTSFCRDICSVLRLHIGKRVEEIGDLDITHML